MRDNNNIINDNYPVNFTFHNNVSNANIDVDNMQNTNDAEGTANNILNRNNITARDHLFQAMFSRIALTYDRTFPPFARRFIEFMLLLTAISVLFILIYIHMAFVKAPITCLDHFAFNDNVVQDLSDGQAKHMVIRVEVLSNPPIKYSLYHSYAKEYDDLTRLEIKDKTDSSKTMSNNNYNGMLIFFNLISKRCDKNESKSVVRNENVDNDKSQLDIKNEKKIIEEKQSDKWLYKLFNFPINPILEKAEYWREKLSVRAMAPFRHTFNELELFAKSVFTEEKYIMEYSLEYGLLRLTPQTRERLNISVHFVLLDANKDQCFGNAISRFLLQEFVGYDQIIIGSLKRLAERQNGKGYVRNVVSGEHYRFVNSWMSRTSYLAAGFIMIIFTLSVSMLLRYSHHQIFVFIVDLLRMLENNLQFSFPAAPLLTVVLALVGMEAIMSEFFNDTSTAFYTILIIWLADQYEAVCCRTYVSKRHWPKYFYLYHFAFYAYHYRFNGQFSGLALLCSWLFIQHSMFFFFHHYELPRLMHGIAVRAIMDSLIVERADNTSRTPSSMFPNDNDDNDRSDGDRFDNDEGPSSSNMQSMAPSGESTHHRENKSSRGQSNDLQESNHSSSHNLHSNNHNFQTFNYSVSKLLLRSQLREAKSPVKANHLLRNSYNIFRPSSVLNCYIVDWIDVYLFGYIKKYVQRITSEHLTTTNIGDVTDNITKQSSGKAAMEKATKNHLVIRNSKRKANQFNGISLENIHQNPRRKDINITKNIFTNYKIDRPSMKGKFSLFWRKKFEQSQLCETFTKTMEETSPIISSSEQQDKDDNKFVLTSTKKAMHNTIGYCYGICVDRMSSEWHLMTTSHKRLLQKTISKLTKIRPILLSSSHRRPYLNDSPNINRISNYTKLIYKSNDNISSSYIPIDNIKYISLINLSNQKFHNQRNKFVLDCLCRMSSTKYKMANIFISIPRSIYLVHNLLNICDSMVNNYEMITLSIHVHDPLSTTNTISTTDLFILPAVHLQTPKTFFLTTGTAFNQHYTDVHVYFRYSVVTTMLLCLCTTIKILGQNLIREINEHRLYCIDDIADNDHSLITTPPEIDYQIIVPLAQSHYHSIDVMILLLTQSTIKWLHNYSTSFYSIPTYNKSINRPSSSSSLLHNIVRSSSQPDPLQSQLLPHPQLLPQSQPSSHPQPSSHGQTLQQQQQQQLVHCISPNKIYPTNNINNNSIIPSFILFPNYKQDSVIHKYCNRNHHLQRDMTNKYKLTL